MGVFVVRKLGVPGYEELTMGAIASGGVCVLNEDVVRELGIHRQAVEAVAGSGKAPRARAARTSLSRQSPAPVRARPHCDLGG